MRKHTEMSGRLVNFSRPKYYRLLISSISNHKYSEAVISTISCAKMSVQIFHDAEGPTSDCIVYSSLPLLGDSYSGDKRVRAQHQ